MPCTGVPQPGSGQLPELDMGAVTGALSMQNGQGSSSALGQAAAALPRLSLQGITLANLPLGDLPSYPQGMLSLFLWSFGMPRCAGLHKVYMSVVGTQYVANTALNISAAHAAGLL